MWLDDYIYYRQYRPPDHLENRTRYLVIIWVSVLYLVCIEVQPLWLRSKTNDGSVGLLSSLRRFLFSKGRCGDTPGWVVCVTALSRVNDEETPQIPSRLEKPGWSWKD